MKGRTQPRIAGRFGGVAAALLLLGLTSCDLNEVEIPDLSGPSGQGLFLQLSANPDVLLADGGDSKSLVQATLFDQNGRPVSGRAILFSMVVEGTAFTPDEFCFSIDDVPSCLGNLELVAGGTQLNASSAIVQTNAQGIAQVRFVAPFNTFSFGDFVSILITARPVGTDVNGQFFRTVRIQLINR